MQYVCVQVFFLVSLLVLFQKNLNIRYFRENFARQLYEFHANNLVTFIISHIFPSLILRFYSAYFLKEKSNIQKKIDSKIYKADFEKQYFKK